MDWNEPMYVEGRGSERRIGVLLIHGFGGSPRSLQELGKRCVDAGYTVALPLLAGHGRTPWDMEATRWQQWVADVERDYQWLRSRTEHTFVCGLSMGGTLALWLAEHHPEISGLVSINTIIKHPREQVMMTAGRLGIPRWVKPVGNDAKDKDVDERAYDRLPVRSTLELARLSRDVRAKLGDVKCPALLFSSTVDHIVPPANQRLLYQAIGSADKTFVELDDCYHLATMDCGKERVCSGVMAFIAGHAAV